MFAQEAEIEAFLEAVACEQLPFGTCEALNAENAKNILRTHRAVLLQRFCGSTNYQASLQLWGMGDALQHNECGELLKIVGTTFD